MARAVAALLRETDLHHWRLVGVFRRTLAAVSAGHPAAPTFTNSQRLVSQADYLSLFLFGLLNPVVRTMRGLCQASHWERLERELECRPVSLGSFSETQHVIEPELLRSVFESLAGQLPACPGAKAGLGQRPWQVVDSTLWEALPRMQWAQWRRQGSTQRALRLHVGFHLLEQTPVRVAVTAGKRCERAVWRQQWQAGDCYVGDRNYGEDYGALQELQQRGCLYVIRLRENAVVRVTEELAVSAADRAAQVQRQAWGQLGWRGPGVRVRLVWVQTPREVLWLATNVAEEQLPGAWVAQLYRQRWQVELFFRWIKCILGNRHWLAESEKGVTVQVYLALIAGVLLQLFTGRRPTRRMMETIQGHLLGWVSTAELEQQLTQEFERQAAKNRS